VDLTSALLQDALNRVDVWTRSSGFFISRQKSEFIIFSRAKNHPPQGSLTLQDSPLPQTNSCKILGMTFDKRHTWKTHILKLKTECQARLHVLKILASPKSGAASTRLLQIQKAIIQSKLDYGSTLYGSASGTTLKTLDTIFNSANRLSLGAFRTSPVHSLHAESNNPLQSFDEPSYALSTHTPSEHPLATRSTSASLDRPEKQLTTVAPHSPDRSGNE